MLNKKLLIGIVVIVLIIVVGFFATKSFNGNTITTGAIAEPGENAGAAANGTTADSSKFLEITESMSAADVVSLVGEPMEKQTTTTAKGHPIEYWYYEAGGKVWQIGISNNEVQVVRSY